MKNIKTLLGLVIIFALSIAPIFTNAQTDEGQNLPVSDSSTQLSSPYVQVRDLKIGSSYDGSAKLNGTFTIENQSADQSVQDYRYTIYIVSKYDSGLAQDIVKFFESNEVVNISPKQSKNFNFSVDLPNLPIGDYGIQVRLFNKAGLSQTWGDAMFKVATSKSDAKPVNTEVQVNNVSILINGEEFELGVGPTALDGQKPQLSIDIQSTTAGKYYAGLTFSKMNSDVVLPNLNSPVFTLKNGLNENVFIDLPDFEGNAGVYDGFLTINTESGSPVTSIIPFRYIIGGNIVTVHNVRSTQETLSKDVASSVTLDVTGVPSNISQGTPTIVEARIEVEATDIESNMKVGSGSIVRSITDEALSVSVPLSVTEDSSAYFVDVKVYDNKTNELLTEYRSSKIEYSVASQNWWKWIAGAILLLILLILLLVRRKPAQTQNIPNVATGAMVFMIMLAGLLGLGVNTASAYEKYDSPWIYNIQGTPGNEIQNLYTSTNIRIRWEPLFGDRACTTLLGAPGTPCRKWGSNPAGRNLQNQNIVPRFNAISGELTLGGTHQMIGSGKYEACINSPSEYAIFKKTNPASKLVSDSERVFHKVPTLDSSRHWYQYNADFSFEQTIPTTEGEHRQRIRLVACMHTNFTKCGIVEGDIIYNITLPDEAAPACGSANGTTQAAPPTSNLCSSGTASAVTASGTNFNWTCSTTRPARTQNCSAVNSGAGSGLSCTVTRDAANKMIVNWTAAVTAGALTDYEFDWTGDVVATNNPSVTRTYTDFGPKTATLTAKNKATGAIDSKTCSVTDGCSTGTKWCEERRACIAESEDCGCATGTKWCAVTNACINEDLVCGGGPGPGPGGPSCGSRGKVAVGGVARVTDANLCGPGSEVVPGSFSLRPDLSQWIWTCRKVGDVIGGINCSTECVPPSHYNPVKGYCGDETCPDWCKNIDGLQPTRENYVIDADGNCLLPEGKIVYFRPRPDTNQTSCPAFWKTEAGTGGRMDCKLNGVAVPSQKLDETGIVGYPIEAGKRHTLSCDLRLSDSDTLVKTYTASARCYKLGEVREQ